MPPVSVNHLYLKFPNSYVRPPPGRHTWMWICMRIRSPFLMPVSGLYMPVFDCSSELMRFTRLATLPTRGSFVYKHPMSKRSTLTFRNAAFSDDDDTHNRAPTWKLDAARAMPDTAPLDVNPETKRQDGWSAGITQPNSYHSRRRNTASNTVAAMHTTIGSADRTKFALL
ncbi:unnamed protein product [Soboliphyme baturini]|uniref:Uncharacterized protein n=1 Tax=Soboliphyme baturini TaxID=241478 RepID=A0A183IPL4_9BILA|nr:unnamed protein product [Soboliphyme baturini]